MHEAGEIWGSPKPLCLNSVLLCSGLSESSCKDLINVWCKGTLQIWIRKERVKWPSPITASEGVIKIKIAGRFLILLPREAAPGWAQAHQIIHALHPLTPHRHSEQLYPKGHQMDCAARYPLPAGLPESPQHCVRESKKEQSRLKASNTRHEIEV